MSLEHWSRVKELLSAVLELEASERGTYLQEICGEDESLRQEVESLLASYEDADDFMEGPTKPERNLTPHDPVVGLRIGPYRVVEEVGHGGMGSVYRAVRADDLFRKQVAIKIVRRGMNHEEVLRRFRNECQILATIEHPNIARLLDGGATADGLPYFVMDYIDGETLDKYCDKNLLGTRERLELFLPICSAVQAAHDQRIVHRDIKPSNILVNNYGQPKLLDFGIAKILDPAFPAEDSGATATAFRMMTTEYASPEQIRGDEITPASDVYSLGVLLYELLSGHKPYRLSRRAPHEVSRVVCEYDPERPSTAAGRTEEVTRGDGPTTTVNAEAVSRARKTSPDELRRSLSGDLDNIILKAMRKDPQRRYQSADELGRDIRDHLDGKPVQARRDSVLYRLRCQLQRNQKTVLTALFAAVLAVVAVVALNRLPSRASSPRNIYSFSSFPGDELQPAFSPDGDQLAFVWTGDNKRNLDIYTRGLGGGPVTRLTETPGEDVSPVWSPDGAQIAWLRPGPDATGVFTMRANGAEQKQVASVFSNRRETIGRHLDWSPDGRYLAAADKVNAEDPFAIWLVEVSTGAKRQITRPLPGLMGDTNPVFSPNGGQVAYIRATSSGVDDLFLVELSTGSQVRLTTDRRYVIGLTWSADGRSLMFSSNRGGNQALWKVSATGGALEKVPVGGENASDPVYSRNGQRIAYTQFYMDTNIWRMDVATGATSKHIVSAHYDSSPQYSPDGRRIAFRSNRSGYQEIWTADADGKGAKQLTHFSAGLTGTPRWSPDGSKIVFDSRPNGPPDIYFIEVDTGTTKQITFDPGEDVVPSWSRDGLWIYFASTRGGSMQVWRVSSEGGKAERLTNDGGFAPFESLDGKTLYYAKGRQADGLWQISKRREKEELVLAQLKGGNWGYWAVGPQGIFFADKAPEETLASIFLFDPLSNAIRRVGSATHPLAVSDSAIAVSPSGKEVLFTQVDQNGSDIMLAEIF
jgi:Tol biopolymer transport system component